MRSTMPGSRLAPVSPASASSTHSGRMTARPGPAAWPAGACALSVNSPNRIWRGRSGAGEAVDVEQVRDAQEVGDELRRGFAVDLLGGPELHDAPAVHHGQPVGHLERFLLVVGHEHEGDADLALQRGELAAQRVAELGIERAQRLVEEEHGRLEGERPGEGDALLLSAGQLVRAALRVLGQSDELEGAGDPVRPGPSCRGPCATAGRTRRSRRTSRCGNRA